jgi:hypothetical protein
MWYNGRLILTREFLEDHEWLAMLLATLRGADLWWLSEYKWDMEWIEIFEVPRFYGT